MKNNESKVRDISKYKQKRRINYTIQIALLLAVIIFIGIKFGIGTELFVRTNIVTYGTLEQDIFLKGLVVRDEKLILAPGNGVFYPKVSESSRIREGQLIGSFKKYDGSIENITAENSGLISFQTDSNENDFQIGSYEELNAYELFDINSTYEVVESGDEVSKGSPIARVVNNHKPAIIIIQVEDEILDSINHEDKNKLKVKLNENNITTANISSMIAEQNIIVLEIKRWEDYLLNKRFCNLKAVVAAHSGFIIPSSSLIKREGEFGVFARSSGRFHWTPVEIVYETKDKSVIEGINGSKAEIIINPRIAKIFKNI